MLKLIDLIGPEPGLTIEKKSIFKSHFGGLMTLFVIFIFIAAFIGFGIDIIQRKKPRVTFNRIKNQNNPEYTFTDSNFFFTFYDQISNLPIPNFDRMFFVHYDYLSFDGYGNSSHKMKNSFHRCPKKTIDKWKSYFIYDPAGYYCFPEDEQIQVKGYPSSGVLKYLTFMVDYCKNNTDPNKGVVKTDCYTRGETQALLFNKRIQMNYMMRDTVINTYNFTFPASDDIISEFLNSDPYRWSRSVISLKQIQINTDKSLLVKYVESLNVIGIDSIKFESFYTPETESVFSNTLIFSDWIEVYDRDYIKFQDIFAMMGGFVNFSLMIIKYFNSYITRTDIVDIFLKNYCYLNTENIRVGESKLSNIASKEVFYNYIKICLE
jgi:hypothetical protein